MADLLALPLLKEGGGKLLDLCMVAARRSFMFKSIRRKFRTTLSSLKPTIDEINMLGEELDLTNETTEYCNKLVKEIYHVLGKCSGVKFWELRKKARYAKKLEDLEAKLLRFFQLNVPAEELRNSMLIRKELKDLKTQITSLISKRKLKVWGCFVIGLLAAGAGVLFFL